MLNSRLLRQRLFLKAFVKNKGNAARAAIEAGYSPKSARQQGHRILKSLSKREIAKVYENIK